MLKLLNPQAFVPVPTTGQGGGIRVNNKAEPNENKTKHGHRKGSGSPET